MRNTYEFDGDILKVHITMKDGTKVCALADAEDFEKIDKYRWHAAKQRDGFRIICHMRLEPKGPKKGIYMHRVVIDAPKGKLVDHINCDPSDNRKKNLRLTDFKGNGHNRKHLHSTNTSGVRNVTWHKRDKHWQACLNVEGKVIYLGGFDEIEQAKEAVEHARRKHMPFSQEAMGAA